MLINAKREKFRYDIRKQSLKDIVIQNRLRNMQWVEDLKQNIDIISLISQLKNGQDIQNILVTLDRMHYSLIQSDLLDRLIKNNIDVILKQLLKDKNIQIRINAFQVIVNLISSEHLVFVYSFAEQPIFDEMIDMLDNLDAEFLLRLPEKYLQLVPFIDLLHICSILNTKKSRYYHLFLNDITYKIHKKYQDIEVLIKSQVFQQSIMDLTDNCSDYLVAYFVNLSLCEQSVIETIFTDQVMIKLMRLLHKSRDMDLDLYDIFHNLTLHDYVIRKLLYDNHIWEKVTIGLSIYQQPSDYGTLHEILLFCEQLVSQPEFENYQYQIQRTQLIEILQDLFLITDIIDCQELIASILIRINSSFNIKFSHDFVLLLEKLEEQTKNFHFYENLLQLIQDLQ